MVWPSGRKRIASVDLPRDKRVEIGLTYIYGIGRVSATKILEKAKVNPDTRCRDLTDEEVKAISEVIDADRQGKSPYDFSPTAIEEIRNIKAILDSDELD